MALLKPFAALVAFLLAFLLPVLTLGQNAVSYNLLNLQVVAGDADGFTATWTVPAGAWARIQKFSMHFTFFNSNNYRRSMTIYPDDIRLNRTGDMYSFEFAGLFSLDSYEEYNSNSYGGGDGSLLITVVGYDGAGYWFSDDVMFAPVKSSAPFELLVLWMSDDFSAFYAKNLADELTLTIRSASSGFIRNRGTITAYQLVGFEGYSVFRGVIRTWGNAAMMYRDSLQQWLNNGIVNGTSIGESLQGKLLYFFSTSSIPVLLSEGPCGFVIDSIDDPYCPSNISIMTMTTSTPAFMTTSSPANNDSAGTDPSTQGNTGNLLPSTSDGSDSSIPYIALVISCLAIVISLLVVVGLALYIVALKRKFSTDFVGRKPRPFSEVSYVKSPAAATIVESPIYERGDAFLIQDDEEFEPEYTSNFERVGYDEGEKF